MNTTTNNEELTKIMDILLGYHLKKAITERPGVKPLTLREAAGEIQALIKAHSEQKALEARIDELDGIPWKRSDKYGINSPYITKEWLLNRKVQLTKMQEQAQLTNNNAEEKKS